jgi:hypothetical protein
MTSDSHGEVFGTKALNLLIIGASVIVLLGVLWQPAPAHVAAGQPTAHIEQVAKAPVPHHFAG